MAYDNELRGILFRNNQKGNDKAPMYKGKIQINGVEYELAAWLKESKKGNKFLSLSASLPKGDSYEPPEDSGDLPF